MSFNITFDYRFADPGDFDDLAKQRLEEAARMWEWFIQDEFPDIPAGTTLNVTNPETATSTTITLDQPIDDLLIFVGATDDPDITSTATAFTRSSLTADVILNNESNDADYQPSVASIVFSTNLNGFANIALAIHEIGHALGFTSASSRFAALGGDGLFDGPVALAVNGGNPIPLEGSHIDNEVEIGGQLPVVNQFGVGNGIPSLADLAILADLGYDIPVLQGPTLPSTLDYYRKGTDGDDFSRDLQTFDGNDFLEGGGGQDNLTGGDGSDTFFFTVGSGDDWIRDFIVADDTIQVSTGYGFSSVDAILALVDRKGTATFNDRSWIWSELPLATNNVITLYHDTTLTAENFTIGDIVPQSPEDLNPALFPTPEPDPTPPVGMVLKGTTKKDKLTGGDGPDILRGRQGNDSLVGKDGDDLLIGGRGRDRHRGGEGNDTFRFGRADLRDRPDVILDFEVGSDVLDLKKVFRGKRFRSNQPYDDYIRLKGTRSRTKVQIDQTGDLEGQQFRNLIILKGVNVNTVNEDSFLL